MRDGFKVFDADAHVVYPPDLWSRFLDKEFVDRVDRKPVAGFDHYNPVTVDGRYTQHLTSILGQFQKAINWTTDDMIAKYGEEIVTQGFTGERVAEAIALEGVDAMVIYGPEYDMWFEGIDPELQAAMARAYNRWGQEMRETSNGVVNISGPVPLNDVTRAVAGDRVRVRAPRHPLLLGAARPVQPPQPRRPLLRPDLRAAPRPRLRVRHARVHGAQRGRPPAPTATTRSPSGTPSCTRTRRRTRCSR